MKPTNMQPLTVLNSATQSHCPVVGVLPHDTPWGHSCSARQAGSRPSALQADYCSQAD